MEKTRNSVDFKVEFDNDRNEIEADTLISALVGLSTAIQEINKEIQPEKKIEVKVKALPRGVSLFI
jgi:hypothetical protein